MSPHLEVGSHAEPTDQTLFEQCEKDPAIRHEIGHIKRFLERWTADSAFKGLVADDPYRAVEKYGIDIDPEVIRPLFDREFAIRQFQEVPAEEIPLPVKRYRRFIDEKFQWRSHIRSVAAPRIEAFRAWRDRQIAHADIELSRFYNDQIVHVPVTFELSVGCSVGCWFCGVGAKGLADHFTYDGDNVRLWRDVLSVIRQTCGPGARYGFCYWATDPIDNPDYEKFCSDFADVMGLFPQTTTAIAMKYPERTRRLLLESAAKGCRINRFSVLTLKTFNQIHETFSADELVFVELVNQNKEADSIKAQSGHYLNSAAKNPAVREMDQRKLRESLRLAGMRDSVPAGENILQPGTTACVSGFLLNMVQRTVKLISPCYASERWPLGYMVFDEGRFEDASGLKDLLDTMIANNMPSSPPPSKTVRFVPGLTFEELEDGFQLSSRAERLQFKNAQLGGYLKEIGRALRNGTSTPADLALRGVYQFGIPEGRTHATLNQFLGMGVLDEVYPKPSAPAGAAS